jgi:hypothetical protein
MGLVKAAQPPIFLSPSPSLHFIPLSLSPQWPPFVFEWQWLLKFLCCGTTSPHDVVGFDEGAPWGGYGGWHGGVGLNGATGFK